jgi:hypothetical protein
MANDILSLANRQKQELAKIDEANLDAISRAYAVSYRRLQGDIDALNRVKGFRHALAGSI